MHRHVEACQAGTLTVEQYCIEQGIKKSVYYYWHKRLTEQPPYPAGFVALNIDGHQNGDVVISYPNGVSIRFSCKVITSVLKKLACCI